MIHEINMVNIHSAPHLFKYNFRHWRQYVKNTHENFISPLLWTNLSSHLVIKLIFGSELDFGFDPPSSESRNNYQALCFPSKPNLRSKWYFKANDVLKYYYLRIKYWWLPIKVLLQLQTSNLHIKLLVSHERITNSNKSFFSKKNIPYK